MDIFWGQYKIGLHFKGHFYASFFLRSRYRMGDIFWGVAKISFFLVLEIPDILLG